MSNNIVSIVIPSYNCSVYLRDMIECVIAQTYNNWELIVVDDNSDDDTLQMLQSFAMKDSRIRWIRRGQNKKGAQSCRNIGLNNSIGDYVCFFDADDLISPYCIEQRFNYLDRHRELDFAVFPGIGFNERPFDRCDVVFGVYTNDTMRSFIGRQLPFVVWNNIYRRNAIINNNLSWDENLLSLQDSDYNIQAIVKGLSFEYANGNVDYFYRLGNACSISKKIFSTEHIKSHCYFFEKLIKTISESYSINNFNTEIISYTHFLGNISCQSENNIFLKNIIKKKNLHINAFSLLKIRIIDKIASSYPSLFTKLYYLFFPIKMLGTKLRFHLWEKEKKRSYKVLMEKITEN